MNVPRKAVILVSGGLDSATALAIAKDEGFKPYAITFRYGQRHGVELEAAKRVVSAAGVAEHIEIEIDLRRIGGSALTDDIDVPKGRELDEMSAGIPVTYVPARNTVFLSFAPWLGRGARGRRHLHRRQRARLQRLSRLPAGVRRAYEAMANLATKRAVEGSPLRIHTPLIDLTKAEIIHRGTELGVDYSITRSCYDPSPAGEACGECDSCLLRLKGFAENGMKDPAPYQRQRAA